MIIVIVIIIQKENKIYSVQTTTILFVAKDERKEKE